MFVRENGSPRAHCLLNMGVAPSGAQRCFVWRSHVCFLSAVRKWKKKGRTPRNRYRSLCPLALGNRSLSEAHLVAELDACRDHHIKTSSFSYRHSSEPRQMCPTVTTLTLGSGRNSPAAQDFVSRFFCMGCCSSDVLSGPSLESSDSPYCRGLAGASGGMLVTSIRVRAHECPIIRFSSLNLDAQAWQCCLLRCPLVEHLLS